MKFIIMLLPITPISYGEGKEVQQSRFHNGFTPILGPIEEEDFDEALIALKENTENKEIIFLAFLKASINLHANIKRIWWF